MPRSKNFPPTYGRNWSFKQTSTKKIVVGKKTKKVTTGYRLTSLYINLVGKRVYERWAQIPVWNQFYKNWLKEQAADKKRARAYAKKVALEKKKAAANNKAQRANKSGATKVGTFNSKVEALTTAKKRA